MRIVLFAHTNLGVACIRKLINTNNEILLVFTHPSNADKNEKVWYESVRDECMNKNILVQERTKLTEEDYKKIKDLNPDIIFSINWRRIIPSNIIKIPKCGSLNIHAGLLPKYSGFSPINWAIINDEKEIGITVHYMDETVDTGDIVLQRKIQVGITDDIKIIFEKVLEIYPNMILDAINFVEAGKNPIKQDKMKRFWVSRRMPKDGRIDWSQNRKQIYNLIRALVDPFPNAFCYYKKQKIYIKKATLFEEDFRGMPGRISSITEKGVVVTCGTNHNESQAILIIEIATEEKTIKANKFFNTLWEDLD